MGQNCHRFLRSLRSLLPLLAIIMKLTIVDLIANQTSWIVVFSASGSAASASPRRGDRHLVRLAKMARPIEPPHPHPRVELSLAPFVL